MPKSEQRKAQNREYDARRRAERPWRALYDDPRWDALRRAHLAEHPLCVMCQAQGLITAATVVDHKIPHKGDHVLMWSQSNWQALCKSHHDRDKQSHDKGGTKKTVIIGADGWPVV